VRHVETRTPAEFEEGFRDFAGRGFDLIFGHGFEYQEAAAKVAAEFPDTVFIGNFDDTAAAREAARALLEEGADLLLHQANDAGRGVFRAVSERARDGARVFAFGTNRNQNGMAPEVVLASAALDIPAAFVEVARRVRDGAFLPEPLRLGMSEGIVALAINPSLRDEIPTGVLDELAQLEREIRSGERVVPRGSF